MITKLIRFVGDKNVPDDFGRGLIGAYALVYFGMAVRKLQAPMQDAYCADYYRHRLRYTGT